MDPARRSWTSSDISPREHTSTFATLARVLDAVRREDL
jgi:hypothetical protein